MTNGYIKLSIFYSTRTYLFATCLLYKKSLFMLSHHLPTYFSRCSVWTYHQCCILESLAVSDLTTYTHSSRQPDLGWCNLGLYLSGILLTLTNHSFKPTHLDAFLATPTLFLLALPPSSWNVQSFIFLKTLNN